MHPLLQGLYKTVFYAECARRFEQAFQDFFADIMCRAYPQDFYRIANGTGHGGGDWGLDGYRYSDSTVFQVYAPRSRPGPATYKRKMRNSLLRALSRPGGITERWVFVHNRSDGLSTDVVDERAVLQTENAAIEVAPYMGPDDLWELVCGFGDATLSELFPEVAAALAAPAGTSAQQVPLSLGTGCGPASMTGEGESTEPWVSVDRLLEERRLAEAIALVEDAAAGLGVEAPSLDRFRIENSRATVAWLRGDGAKAVQHYRLAAQFLGASEPRHILCQAIADHIEGHNEEATAKAEHVLSTLQGASLRRDREDRATAASLLAVAAPPDVPLVDLVTKIGEESAAASRVAFALGRRAAIGGFFAEAEVWARRSLSAPDAHEPMAEPRGLLIDVLLAQRFGPTMEAVLTGPPEPDWPAHEEVCTLAQAALDRLSEDSPDAVRGYLWQRLGLAHVATGRYTDAAEALERAVTLLPDSAAAVRALAQALCSKGNVTEAEAALRAWLERNPESPEAADGTLCLSVVLANAGRAGDALELLIAARDRAAATPELYREWLAGEIQLAFACGDLSRARDALAELGGTEASAVDHLVLGATVLLLAGDPDAARRSARSAVEIARSTAEAAEVPAIAWQRLATLCAKLDEPGWTAEAWRRLASPSTAGPAERAYVSALGQANRKREMADFCRAVRLAQDRPRPDPWFLNAELWALDGEPERFGETATELLREAQLDEHESQLLVAKRTSVGHYLGRPDWVVSGPEALPSVQAVRSAREGAIVTSALRRNPDHLLSIDYAYHLFRRFHEQYEAWTAVLESFGLPAGPFPQVPEVDTVARGCAVELGVERSDGTAETRWLVIEEQAEVPIPALDEFSVSHPWVQALEGCRTGDRVTLSGAGPDVLAVISQVQSKYLRRFQKCLVEVEERFPELAELMRVQVDTSTPDSLRESLMARFGTQERNQEALLDDQARARLPLAAIAKGFGRHVFQVLSHLAADPRRTIRCNDGGRESRRDGRAHLDSGRPLVLDPTAVASLIYLRRCEALTVSLPLLLQLLGRTCIVPASLVDELRSLRSWADVPAQGHLSIQHGRPVYVPVWKEVVLRERAVLDEALEMATMIAQRTVGVSRLAPLEFASERDSVELLGGSTVDALALAREAQAGLWTDDVFLWSIAAELGYGGPRVWTSLVVEYLAECCGLASTEHASIVGEMIAAGYATIAYSAEVVNLAGQRCDWDAAARPLRALLAALSDPQRDEAAICGIACAVLGFVWRDCTPVKAKGITTVVLDRLAGRPGHRAVVERLATMLRRPSARGALSIENRASVEAAVRRWLDNRPPRH